MWQALSLRWGIPLGELMNRITYREFLYWVEVYKNRPFDDEATQWLPAALIRADMRGLAGSKKKVTIEDLMPFRDTSEEALERKIDQVLT